MPTAINSVSDSGAGADAADGRSTRWRTLDLFSVFGLAALSVYFLLISWRKWPDPLVDFGRELYTPWQLANGAVLYRDIECYYGPFSQYFNGVVFAIFGPSLMALVWVNLAIFTAILFLFYARLRRGWGTLAAFVAGAVFVTVFGFSQYVRVGNFNYATPYAHETTHGLLVCLLLVTVLPGWVRRAGIRTSFVSGLLCGLTAVLKPEIMLAAGLVMFTAVGLRWWHAGRLPAAVWLAWLGGATLPSLGFLIYFRFHLPLREALAATGNAWLSVVNGSHTDKVIQAGFLGTDRPWLHLAEHFRATLIALAVLAGVSGAAWIGTRATVAWRRYGLCALLVAAMTWIAVYQIAWPEVGRCLLGLTLLYTAVKIAPHFRAGWRSTEVTEESLRLLLAVLAAGLLVRMALNGRIYQYGFYQAALAAMLVPAVLLGEVGGWFHLKRGNLFMVSGTLALLVPGMVFLAHHSQGNLRLKTESVGRGGDRFYALPTAVDASGQIVRLALDFLDGQPRGQSLVVLPEGVSINYLARRPSPLPTFAFYGASTAGGREAVLVEKVRRNPPDWVMLVSLDLRAYGISRYGEKSGEGQDLLRWLTEDYQRIARTGGDPLEPGQPGAQIFAKKAGPR